MYHLYIKLFIKETYFKFTYQTSLLNYILLHFIDRKQLRILFLKFKLFTVSYHIENAIDSIFSRHT